MDSFAVATQAREGIETSLVPIIQPPIMVATQAREGIETFDYEGLSCSEKVATQAREGIETQRLFPVCMGR